MQNDMQTASHGKSQIEIESVNDVGHRPTCHPFADDDADDDHDDHDDDHHDHGDGYDMRHGKKIEWVIECNDVGHRPTHQ